MWKLIKLYKDIKWWFIWRTNYIWKNGRWKVNCASSKATYSAQWEFTYKDNGSS